MYTRTTDRCIALLDAVVRAELRAQDATARADRLLAQDDPRRFQAYDELANACEALQAAQQAYETYVQGLRA